MTKPLHPHKCNYCIYLGSSIRVDYYYCDNPNNTAPTVEIINGVLETYKGRINHLDDNVELHTAAILAARAGYINFEDIKFRWEFLSARKKSIEGTPLPKRCYGYGSDNIAYRTDSLCIMEYLIYKCFTHYSPDISYDKYFFKLVQRGIFNPTEALNKLQELDRELQKKYQEDNIPEEKQYEFYEVYTEPVEQEHPLMYREEL